MTTKTQTQKASTEPNPLSRKDLDTTGTWQPSSQGYVVGSMGIPICQGFGTDMATMATTQRFIAASPDMARALLALMERAVVADQMLPPGKSGLFGPINAARQALEKAGVVL